MCMLIRILVSIAFCLPLCSFAQCGAEKIQPELPGVGYGAQVCDPTLSLSITTRERWQLNMGLLETYRADAKLPLGVRSEKSDNFHRWVEVTRILQIEKRF